jgi:ABC-type multidrug transport system ATPase subunit
VTVELGRTPVLCDVSVTVRAGSVHALLGHNGAGKTTLVRAIAGLVPRRSGTVTGATDLGVVLAGARFPRDLTVRQIQEYQRRLTPPAPGTDPVAQLGVDEFLERRGGQLSTGMAQRLELARVLLAGARNVILDEPTLGLDPDGVARLRDAVRLLASQGHAVLLCSHDLAELELVCDHVTCLRAGRVTASGTVEQLAATVPPPGHIIRTDDDARAAQVLGTVAPVERTARGIRLPAGLTPDRWAGLLAGVAHIREIDTDPGLFHRIFEQYASAPAHQPSRRHRRGGGVPA